MTKTYRTIQQWDHWLTQFLGKSVLEAEQQFLSSLLFQRYGKHALLIGSPRQQVLLKTSVMSNLLLLGPLINSHRDADVSGIESEFYELPIASGTVDLVLLPHILEHVDNPNQLLAEACRVIKPEGHIIICGFNPYSFWGLRKLFTRNKHMPWSGTFIKPSMVKKWLGLSDFELIEQHKTLYRPPITQPHLFQRLKFLEWLGKKCFSPFGGVYFLLARAKVVPLTPIKLRWKQHLSGVQITSRLSGNS